MGDETSHKREAADAFGAAATAYRESPTHRAGPDLDRVQSWCTGGTRGLDVATGAGHTAGAQQRAGVDRVVAFDAAPEMVATAEEAYPGVDGVVGDAEALPFGDDAFDVVTCRIAAHHFPDPAAFVVEVARVLESGGTFALEDSVAPAGDLRVFINRVERRRDPTHVESYTLATWMGWLETAGFTVEETETIVTSLDFEGWLDAQSVPLADRRAIEALLLEAPPAAIEAFRITSEDGHVTSFANHKGLLRATR